jgi:hypothetical protein
VDASEDSDGGAAFRGVPKVRGFPACKLRQLIEHPGPAHRVPQAMFVSRTAELDRLERVLEGGALVIHGEAGIGKTTLLDVLVARAGDRVTTLRARGVETEAELAFCALADLLAPCLDALDALPTRQRAALEAALALAPPAPGDRLAVCVATLGVLRAAAQERPVPSGAPGRAPGPARPALAGVARAAARVDPARRPRARPAQGHRPLPAGARRRRAHPARRRARGRRRRELPARGLASGRGGRPRGDPRGRRSGAARVPRPRAEHARPADGGPGTRARVPRRDRHRARSRRVLRRHQRPCALCTPRSGSSS